MKQDPPKPRPVVLRQAWALVLEDGTRHDMGHSYHLTEEDRAAYVSDVLDAHEPSFQAEPLGDPTRVHVTEEQWTRIRATPHGLRVR